MNRQGVLEKIKDIINLPPYTDSVSKRYFDICSIVGQALSDPDYSQEQELKELRSEIEKAKELSIEWFKQKNEIENLKRELQEKEEELELLRRYDGYHSQFPSQGLKWVKASERLPELYTDVHAKLEEFKYMGRFKEFDGEIYFNDECEDEGVPTLTKKHFEKLFWLDDKL